ncbi:hypothetical protein C8R44DRAFT_991343 [Mycena epipterygia]|nr:hypothetical protein C8R44DRAFT_991343 [Mycena epipterygia]
MTTRTQTSSGLGNIRPPSTSREAARRSLDSGHDDFSSTRGREPARRRRQLSLPLAQRHPRPADDKDVRYAAEREMLKLHAERERDVVHSTGRGGLGNMSRSRSRGPWSPLASPSPSRNNSSTTAVHPQVHSSGRGGAGNIAPGPAPAYERGRTGAIEGIHSTGRGGLANLTSAPIPPQDAPLHVPGTYESTGRGGVGNMSRSRERGSGEKGGIAGLWNRMHPHPHGHAPAPAPPPHGQPETILEG